VADTITQFLEKEKCEDCGKPPVVVTHHGGDKVTKLCRDCWRQRALEGQGGPIPPKPSPPPSPKANLTGKTHELKT